MFGFTVMRLVTFDRELQCFLVCSSSPCYLLFIMVLFVFQVEVIQTLVLELAIVAAQEKAMLDECIALLASTAALQVGMIFHCCI